MYKESHLYLKNEFEHALNITSHMILQRTNTIKESN